MSLRLILLLLGGVIVLAILLDAWRRKRIRDKLTSAKVDQLKTVKSTADTKSSTQLANARDYNKAIEPIIGDPTLAELGFGNSEDFTSAILSDNRAKSNHTTPTNHKNPSSSATETILIINILAPKGQRFMGYELLQTLLAAGMRYGDMSIFHYYQMQDDKEQILFSLASATEPGIFDLTNIGGLSCSGLSLFMRAQNPQHALQNFSFMLETAKQIADDLGGDLFDEKRQPWTAETFKSYRARIVT